MLEERDLVMKFGDLYRRYQKEVPMLIPKGYSIENLMPDYINQDPRDEGRLGG